jgi:hypothetical protein
VKFPYIAKLSAEQAERSDEMATDMKLMLPVNRK